MASIQSVGELLVPTARHLLKIRAVAGEVPRLAPEDLDAPLGQVLLQVGNGIAQRNPRLPLGERLGDHPHAYLVALETGFEKLHTDLQQVVFSLVEQGDVLALRHVCHDSQACLSHPVITGSVTMKGRAGGRAFVPSRPRNAEQERSAHDLGPGCLLAWRRRQDVAIVDRRGAGGGTRRRGVSPRSRGSMMPPVSAVTAAVAALAS
jgi:hypothetical protein